MIENNNQNVKDDQEETFLERKIDIYGAITTPWELFRETLVNFTWGFMGNASVVFVSQGKDFLVFMNFVFYYLLISYIVNRNKYTTRLGKFIILPGSAAFGAYTGYKAAQFLANLI
jgi:hypothetical protein